MRAQGQGLWAGLLDAARLPALLGMTLLIGGCRPAATPARQPAPLYDPAAAERLEGPERDRHQQPERLVKTLGIKPGSRVADLGAGTGYLLPHLSRAVGPKGEVYAEEIQETFLAALERRRKAHPNVDVVLGVPADPRLPEPVDLFVMLTVYHEVARPVAFLETLHRYARPGARLAVIDFDPEIPGSPVPVSEHSVKTADVIREAAAAGWRLESRHPFLGGQFFLIFGRARQAPKPG